ncbi:peptide/nickel transport system ATP-binding protein [Desulfacinum hydrothermale DSM 13146]|uniref:Peptide/nickel transport system ATP-binding protein n=1 Tax=Desulfacinum hydrothermale DSM 13146 TaxID=1121390 RepID=A0A1W1XPY3_9BACT|nr:ABC transporter ATP-binding protein [Desulfacinum hydrothermale]SMC25956.1 peptide/nickel transport system ATP-binding protein [Desulfacinum hydrothermale DSM 13146]
MDTDLLRIQDLSVRFFTYQGVVRALEGVWLSVRRGEILGLVGETGCGKSVLARSILRLIADPPGKISGGRILFKGRDLLALPMKEMRRIRGNDISMIFQEPMTSLNPVFTVGNQMEEVVRLHQKVSRKAARRICVEMLTQVRMPDAEAVLRKYPHELSGGMRQRVMIALELSCRPDLLIADEPTTALDVTVQAQVLHILSDLTRARETSVLFITHDLGVVAHLCDRVAVMYAGKIVETAPVEALFQSPRHPYTRGLLAAVPSLDEDREFLASIPGVVPGLIDPPGGCRFHPRCDGAGEPCRRMEPAGVEVGEDHWVFCHGIR